MSCVGRHIVININIFFCHLLPVWRVLQCLALSCSVLHCLAVHCNLAQHALGFVGGSLFNFCYYSDPTRSRFSFNACNYWILIILFAIWQAAHLETPLFYNHWHVVLVSSKFMMNHFPILFKFYRIRFMPNCTACIMFGLKIRIHLPKNYCW